MNAIIIQMYRQKDDVQCFMHQTSVLIFILYSTRQSLFILVYLIKFLITTCIFMPMRVSNNCLNLSEPFTRGFPSLSAPNALIITV